MKMPFRLCCCSLTACFVLVAPSNAIYGQGLQVPAQISPTASESGVVNEAGVVLQELARGAERIPERLLAEAAGIAIIPHYMRGAFVVGVSGGRGVLLARDQAGRWLAPEFITMGGGSVGWQIGVQATDLVLVFRSPKSLDNIRQGKLTLGADASAAAGPMGRYASAATDARMQAEILTYSRSRGLFAGISLSGSSLQLDVPATQAFYQMGPNGTGTVPQSAQALVNELIRFTSVQQPGISQEPPTPNPTGLNGGQTSSNATSIDPLALNLANAVGLLQARVDEQWKQYLALPPDWFSGRRITDADVHSVLIRYERVETNPQLAALRALPEFQQTLQEIRALAARIEPSPNQLVLPPPPRAAMVGDSRILN